MSLKQIISQYGVEPKHRRGLNFLIDQNVLKKIVALAGITHKTHVVEIGAGLGFLTKLLAEKAKKVLAIEIDKELAKILIKECESFSNIRIVQDDARDVDMARLGVKDHGYVVVANIPYNITSILIQKFLESKIRPSKLILLIQKEVGERICAKPPNMNLLALSVQYNATARILFSVSKQCFFPRPKVESVVLEIEVYAKEKEISLKERAFFFQCIHAGFSQKRKFLLSNLSKELKIDREKLEHLFSELRISLTARAQELSLEQWEELINKLKINSCGNEVE